ncbi:cysteine-rich protein 1 isoform X1 [Syngnathoides biaculeatus]|uniref:cysteine-rich protein 1 isoform X1 n=1 Tax=Syngnathoides biaculeatus TaxID=300417 RepID=UPI002ADDCC58|nr:cysteine-rich protein 1 isoform X1 [Syngnathoides biaculeatus]
MPTFTHVSHECCGFTYHSMESEREKKRSLGRDYHPLCLKCQKCKRQLTAGKHAEYDEKPYCSYCYMKMFGPRGTR